MTDDDLLIDLLARVALRDRAAFQQLYQQSSAHLFGIVMRMIRHKETAEEILQEAYVQIWERAGDYQSGKGRPLTWCAAIARYRCLDRLRRNKSRPEYTGIEITDNHLEPKAEDTERLEANAERDHLNRCLSELPEEARACILHAYVDGYSHSELSTQLGHPIGTVKSWIRRGLSKLQTCMHAATVN